MCVLFASLTILQRLEQWDKWLFVKINSGQSNALFDAVMPYLRNSNFWIPLYLFLLVFIITNYPKKAIWWIIMFICTVALTDMVSSRVFKEAFQRLRPCNSPDMLAHLHLLVKNCSTGFSFTSSHATNHFGMATFFFFTFRHIFKKYTYIIFIWAAAISYAQVYVGVHYPADILGGTVLGMLLGLMTGMFFNKRFGFINFDK